MAEDLTLSRRQCTGDYIGEVEEAVSNVKKSQAELGERQKTLKLNFTMNYCENFRKQLTAPLFIPAEGTIPVTAAASTSSGGGTLIKLPWPEAFTIPSAV